MSSSAMITLFAEPRPLTQDPYSIAFSVLTHGVVIGLVTYVMAFGPHVTQVTVVPRYTLRLLEMHMPDPPPMAIERPDDPKPNPLSHTPSPAKSEASTSPALQQLAKKSVVQQTLIQPDAPPDLILPKEVPLPAVQLWTAADVAKLIVPPKMQKIAASRLTPNFNRPNNEVKLADIQMTSTAFSTDKLPIIASKSSPLNVNGPDIQKPSQIQQTASLSNKQPTGAAVISISDLVMREGTTAMPLISQSASGAPAVRLAAQRHEGTGQQATGTANGTSYGEGSSYSGANRARTKRITNPKDGKFTSVVVGNALEQQYPETAGMLSGRMAYTVYLPVHSAKKWILQFALPRGADLSGSSIHLDAPWPLDMVVPNFAPGDINSDAVVVHALLNSSGKFEKLSVAFPPQFAQAQFLLDTLKQWQFRAAVQNGQNTAVEVLLVIPETMD